VFRQLKHTDSSVSKKIHKKSISVMKNVFILSFPTSASSSVYLTRSIFFIFFCLLSSCATILPVNTTQKNLNTGLKTVHTFDVYAENSTIHSLFSGLDKQSQKLTLNYINSQDSGKTWSTPITVNQNISPVKKSKRGNDFQVAASGNKVMAVWQTQGGEPWTGVISSAISYDTGKTWHKTPSPVDNKYSKIDQGYFDLSADPQGNFHIVWLDDREEIGDTQVLRYASFLDKENDSLWQYHNELESSACTCCWSRISSDTLGNIHVLFRDDNPRDMMLISSFDKGQSWQKPHAVWPFNWQFVGCPHQGGGITTMQTDGKTILHSVVWNGNNSNRGLYYKQSTLTDNTSPVVQIGTDTSFSGDIAALNNNHVGIIYTISDIEKKRVVTKVSSDGGNTWSSAHQLSIDEAKPSHPRIVATPEGFKFFWTEWQENGDAVAILSEFN
jgi:hypothetical protein